MSESDLNKTVTQIIRQMRKPDDSDDQLENVVVTPVRKSLRIKMSKPDVVSKNEEKAIVKRKAVKKSSSGKRKAEPVILKRDIKMRRLGSDNLNKDDSLQKFDLLIAPTSRFVGKVGKACSIDVITNINSKLSPDQMSIFKSSRFGVFLGLGKDVLSLRLIHSILLREVHYPDMSELWFNFGSRNMRFSLYEFGLVSGLVCGGDESRFSNYCDGGIFYGKFFGDDNRITRQVIEAKFNDAVWDNDDDAVKFAKLYFVQCFLLGSLESTLVDSRFIHLLDCPDFDDFPWGKYSFQLFVQSTKNKLWTFLQASKQSTFYRLYGFPHAIQFWFYETLTTVPDFLCSLSNAAAFPRFLRWSPKNIKKIQNFDFKVYDDPTEKVKAGPNIKATDFELSQNIVTGLSHQHFIAASSSDDESILEVAKSACSDFVNELKDLVFDSGVEYSDLELDIRKQIYDSIVNFENNKLTDIFKDNSGEDENVEEQIYSSDNDVGDSSSKDNDNSYKEETENEEQQFNDEDVTVLDGGEIDAEVHDQSIAENVSGPENVSGLDSGKVNFY
ncbi:uncharacterized protein LOC130015131 [Mercurialis annua]|uniref:uncharacterized protein LOC130015131 n=1 Tax=Mercurialis annua TaxID=3986 RepID=UPI0024AD6746|nr:uncharacterized protein LOC130015131 [Mercurialis annua]